MGKICSCCSWPSVGEEHLLQVTRSTWGRWLLLSAQMGAAFLLQEGGLWQRCYWHHRRRNFLDGSSRLTILQQAVSFHFLKWAVTSSLLPSEKRTSARPGKGWLRTSSSCFGEARLQPSCFSLWGCWHTELRVIFNHQNRPKVPLDWFCVLSIVLLTVAPRQEADGDGRGGRHSWLYEVFLAFLRPISTICHHVHRSAVASFPRVLLASRRERCGSSESQE